MKKQGRPRKDGVNLHCQVEPAVKDALIKIAAKNKISQGDALALCVESYNVEKEEKHLASLTDKMRKEIDHLKSLYSPIGSRLIRAEMLKYITEQW